MSALELLKQKLAEKIRRNASFKKQENEAVNPSSAEPTKEAPAQSQDNLFSLSQAAEPGTVNMEKQKEENPKPRLPQRQQVNFEESGFVSSCQVKMGGSDSQELQEQQACDSHSECSFSIDQNQAPVKRVAFSSQFNKQKRMERIQLKKEAQCWKEKDPNISKIQPLKLNEEYRDPFVVNGNPCTETEEEIENRIALMVNQQSRHEGENENEEDRKKQLMVDTIKTKKRKPTPKPMDKATPFHQLSLPYQEIKVFASYLPIYDQRRKRQLCTSIVDLGVRNLQEIVFQCFSEGLISKQVIMTISDRGVEREIEFIRKFAENKLHQFDFKSVKFTPMDHRKLCGILLKHHKKYVLGERIYCIFKEITDFQEAMYALEESEYQRLCRNIAIRFNLDWWESIEKESCSLMAVDDKFDTSTIYKQRPSPLFGIELQNPSLEGYYRAKNQKYPQAGHKKRRQDDSDSESYNLNSSSESLLEPDLSVDSNVLSSSIHLSTTKKNTSQRSNRYPDLSSSMGPSSFSGVKSSMENYSQSESNNSQVESAVGNENSRFSSPSAKTNNRKAFKNGKKEQKQVGSPKSRRQKQQNMGERGRAKKVQAKRQENDSDDSGVVGEEDIFNDASRSEEEV